MICFELSEEQSVMKETAAKMVKNLIADNAHQMDEEGQIPDSYLDTFWELGTTPYMIPEEYGGYGMGVSPLMNSLVLEELAAGDMGYAVAATLPGLVVQAVLDLGSEPQKEQYLPDYCGDTYTTGTLAICEKHFGSDPAEPRTTAVKKNGSVILNGEKCLVPMANRAEHVLVWAGLDGKNALFMVDKNTPGMSIGEREKNIGPNTLETYTVSFNDCEIPAEQQLGDGEDLACRKILHRTRTALSAMGTGIARASFEYARDYAKERVQFGEPIAGRQSVAFMIAEMAYEVDAMRLMTWKAASALEARKDAARSSYLAKLYAGEMAMKVTDFGVQVLGGHGYVRDHPVERYYRNGRTIAVLEGMAAV